MEIMSFRIVVDSGCDMLPEMLRDSCFVRVPLSICSNGKTFIDDDTFDQAELLRCMKQSDQAPSTACPSPQAYLDAYRGGVEDIYVVTLSARLSGSYNSAVQAKLLLEEENPEAHVHVFNSRSAVCGETLIARTIKEVAKDGRPFHQVVEKVEAFIDGMTTLVVLEDLENLRKNGRLSKLQAVVTGALKIKLFLHATPEGEIDKIGQALTIKQALAKMVDRAANDPGHKGKPLIIGHCNCPERASQVREMFEQKCSFSDISLVEANGITTVYANDGGIVAAY